jgi:prepilin-type N-terminal cleavage/methylation domain-containing protein
VTPRPAARGFTLLELVLALTALALLVGICYAAFDLGLRAVRGGQAAVVTQQRLRAVMDVMMRQLKSAYPYLYATREGDYPVYFWCDGKVLSFVTASGQLSGGLPSWVSYEIETDPPALKLSETTLFDPKSLAESLRFEKPSDGMDQETMASATLIDGFTSLRFDCPAVEIDMPSNFRPGGEDETDTMPLYVTISFEGLPGFPGVLKQQVPLTTAYSEESGAISEEVLSRVEAAADKAEDEEDAEDEDDTDQAGDVSDKEDSE